MSVLEHGENVWEMYTQIMNYIRNDGPKQDWWRIPEWVMKNKPTILSCLYEDEIMKEYLIYHDCGKVTTATIDENGKRHFPGHAQESERLWISVGGNATSARLMGMDMDAHLLKGDGVEEFAKRPESVSLLIAAIAEVHSNAEMFGGTNSDSFKIKIKHLDKRGKQVMRSL